MARCPNFSMVAWQHDTDTKRVVMARIGCGMWNCEVCAAKMRRKWITHLRKTLPELSGVWWLITFTAPPFVTTYEDSVERLRRGIDLFMKRARRIWQGIEYVRVYEKHETRTAIHAHIVIKGVTPYVSVAASRNGKLVFGAVSKRPQKNGFWGLRTFVKKIAVECDMGYIADAKIIPADKGIFYIAAYLNKDAQAFYMRHLRHIQTSQGIGSPKDKETGFWYVGRRIFAHDIQGDEELYDSDRKAVVNNKFWKENEFYPPNND